MLTLAITLFKRFLTLKKRFGRIVIYHAIVLSLTKNMYCLSKILYILSIEKLCKSFSTRKIKQRKAKGKNAKKLL